MRAEVRHILGINLSRDLASLAEIEGFEQIKIIYIGFNKELIDSADWCI